MLINAIFINDFGDYSILNIAACKSPAVTWSKVADGCWLLPCKTQI